MSDDENQLVLLENDRDHPLLQLQKTVILAYTDTSAAGSRALLGVDMRVEYESWSLPDVDSLRPACVRSAPPRPHERHFLPVQILNHKYEQFSLVVINTVLPGTRCHYVLARVMDTCLQSDVERLIILSALRLDLPSKTPRIYENVLNTSLTLTGEPPLPVSVCICDPVLSTCIQMALVDGIPTHILSVPAYKAQLGHANTDDGSQQIILLFQETLTSLFRLRFDNDLSNSLLYKGKNPATVDMASLLYV